MKVVSSEIEAIIGLIYETTFEYSHQKMLYNVSYFGWLRDESNLDTV